MTPEELARFRALATEFQSELAAIGANIKDINSRLDALARDVADIQDYLRRQIKFSGDLFGGFRSDQSRVPFYDYSGAVRNANRSLLENVSAVHDFHLDARGTLPGGVKANVDLVASNYLSYRANSVTGSGAPGPNPLSSSGPVGATLLGGPSGCQSERRPGRSDPVRSEPGDSDWRFRQRNAVARLAATSTRSRRSPTTAPTRMPTSTCPGTMTATGSKMASSWKASSAARKRPSSRAATAP